MASRDASETKPDRRASVLNDRATARPRASRGPPVGRLGRLSLRKIPSRSTQWKRRSVKRRHPPRHHRLPRIVRTAARRGVLVHRRWSSGIRQAEGSERAGGSYDWPCGRRTSANVCSGRRHADGPAWRTISVRSSSIQASCRHSALRAPATNLGARPPRLRGGRRLWADGEPDHPRRRDGRP